MRTRRRRRSCRSSTVVCLSMGCAGVRITRLSLQTDLRRTRLWRRSRQASPGPTSRPASAYRSPLALALEASAVSVLVEGDRWGEGAIAFDMVCSGDPDGLTTLAQDLADYVPDTGMRPPWVDPPLTARRARGTANAATAHHPACFPVRAGPAAAPARWSPSSGLLPTRSSGGDGLPRPEVWPRTRPARLMLISRLPPARFSPLPSGTGPPKRPATDAAGVRCTR